MPNLKEVRIRIASVKSTQQITSAMKMVSASKLRRAQNAIITLRPYAKKIAELLQNLSASLENMEENIFSQQRTPEKILIIVIASNRGMCGAFNSNVIKEANALIYQKYFNQNEKRNVSLVCIGRKATEYFKKRNYNIFDIKDELLDGSNFDQISAVAESLMQLYVEKKVDKIDLIYNQFKNPAVQTLVVEQYLPILPPKKVASSQSNRTDYIFEPNKNVIVSGLIPKSLKNQFYKAILDSIASEHGARMTAMHKATDNATELLKDLTIAYNNARQAAITNEILEIVNGANALKG